MTITELLNELKRIIKEKDTKFSFDETLQIMRDDLAEAIYSEEHNQNIKDIFKDDPRSALINAMLSDISRKDALPHLILTSDYVVNNIISKLPEETLNGWIETFDLTKNSQGKEVVLYPVKVLQKEIKDNLSTMTNQQDIDFLKEIAKEGFVIYSSGYKLVSVAGKAEHELEVENKKLVEESEFGKTAFILDLDEHLDLDDHKELDTQNKNRVKIQVHEAN